jgi:pilus assembly protein CpaF
VIVLARVNLHDELLRQMRSGASAAAETGPEYPAGRVERRLLEGQAALLAEALTDPAAAAGPLRAAIAEAVAGEREGLTEPERLALVSELEARLLGLGILQPLLEDAEVTDILVNRHDAIFICRRGQLERTPLRFRDEAAVRGLAERLAGAAGRPLSEERPTALVLLADGVRVRILQPPLTRGVVLALRKPAPPDALGPADLVVRSAWTEELRDFLGQAARAGFNLVLYGETGSGKTTGLRAICRLLGEGRATPPRLVVLEHTSELNLPAERAVAVQAVERAGAEGISLFEAFPVTMQLLPQVVIVGEILDREALPFLYAALSGHQCLGTIHAGRPDLAIWRLAVLAHAGGLSEALAERLVRGTIDLLIEHRALPDGRLAVTGVAEVLPDGAPRDLFRFREGALRRVGDLTRERAERLEGGGWRW